MSVWFKNPLISRSVLITVVVEEEVVVTLPLATISVKSGSCILITSPGLSIPPFIPVSKLHISFSFNSPAKCHLPYLIAWPSEVQPKAVTLLVFTFPVLAISSLSSTVTTSCLYALSGLFQVTTIWLFLNLVEVPWYVKSPLSTFDFVNVYTAPFWILAPRLTCPFHHINILLIVVVKFFNIFIAFSVFCI